jgi:hypothetical protein
VVTSAADPISFAISCCGKGREIAAMMVFHLARRTNFGQEVLESPSVVYPWVPRGGGTCDLDSNR